MLLGQFGIECCSGALFMKIRLPGIISSGEPFLLPVFGLAVGAGNGRAQPTITGKFNEKIQILQSSTIGNNTHANVCLCHDSKRLTWFPNR